MPFLIVLSMYGLSFRQLLKHGKLIYLVQKKRMNTKISQNSGLHRQ